MIPWTRPRGAVHDLFHLLSLSDERTILLCLSEREMYVLQNWLALDLEFESRYAVTLQNKGYEQLDREHPLWPYWRMFVNEFTSEAIDMSCDLLAVLQEIRDQIETSNARLLSISQAITNKVIPDHDYGDVIEGISTAVGNLPIDNPTWATLLQALSGSLEVSNFPTQPDWPQLVGGMTDQLVDIAEPETDFTTLFSNLVAVIEATRTPPSPTVVRNSVDVSDICCPPLNELPVRDADPLDIEIVPDDPFCERSRSFAWIFSERMVWALGILKATNSFNLSMLAVYLSEFRLSLGAISQIFNSAVGNDFDIADEDLEVFRDIMFDEITCALWENVTPATGRAAMITALGNIEKPQGWPTFGNQLLWLCTTFVNLNSIYDGTYPILPQFEGYDCDALCGA